MVFRDSLGNELNEGDKVAFAMAPGIVAPGTIFRLSSGIGNLQNPNPVGHCVVMIMVPLNVAPHGVVQELLKAVAPEQAPKPEEPPKEDGSGLIVE